MRIQLFIGQLAGGGAEKVLTMLANHYVEKGHQVEIVMLLGHRVEKEHFDLNESVDIVDLSIEGSYIKNILGWLKRIRKHVKGTNPDAIISFIGRINALVLTALVGIKVPVLISERSDPHHDGRGALMLKYCDFIYRKASAIAFQTSYQQNCFSKAHKRHSYIIPNPICILPLPEEGIDPMLVVTTGRLHPAKNHSLLISAMAIVKSAIPAARCEIYGDGDLQETLQSEINHLGLQEAVILAGKKSNVTDYVSKCSVFVMSSDYEGLSNSLMEAMMLGKICISTDYPGVEDLVEDGKNGIIVPRGDSRRLANAIANALCHKYNAALGDNARKKMLGYDEKNILMKWDEVLMKIVG